MLPMLPLLECLRLCLVIWLLVASPLLLLPPRCLLPPALPLLAVVLRFKNSRLRKHTHTVPICVSVSDSKSKCRKQMMAIRLKVLIINNAEDGENKFSEPISNGLKEKGIEVDVVYWCAITNTVTLLDANKYDAVIATGSSQGDDPMKTREPVYKDWMGKLPFFGICTGHHLQGYMSGMSLIRDGSQSESGDLPVVVVKDDPIFQDVCTLGNEFIVKQMHNDAISLPEGFELLASSDRCACQMMKHQTHPLVYTTQFHPEFYNLQLLYNFCELVGAKRDGSNNQTAKC